MMKSPVSGLYALHPPSSAATINRMSAPFLLSQTQPLLSTIAASPPEFRVARFSEYRAKAKKLAFCGEG
jgi:hypothetical protein